MAAFVGSGVGVVSASAPASGRSCRTKVCVRMVINAQAENSEQGVDDAGQGQGDRPLYSRRVAIQSAAAVLVAGACVGRATPAHAALPAPSGVAALVSSYKDIPKGFSMYRPSGWNEFTTLPDMYDVKWQDIIQPSEQITVLTTPVTKGKTTESLGTPEEVGARLAKTRNGTLVAASERENEGVKVYTVELKLGNLHQLVALSVNKSKLYSVTATCGEPRWPKREKLYRGCLDSFLPKL